MTEPKSSRVTMKSLRSQLMQAQDQLVALHEVLEELCDRQEAQSVWQIELSKQLLSGKFTNWMNEKQKNEKPTNNENYQLLIPDAN